MTVDGDPTVLTPVELDGIDAVVTTARVAIALSGTIILDAGPGQGRRAITLVPDFHLVVLYADQVVQTVPEAIARLDPVRPLDHDRRPVRDQRHRTRTGRRRARPTHPVRAHRALIRAPGAGPRRARDRPLASRPPCASICHIRPCFPPIPGGTWQTPNVANTARGRGRE